MASCNTLHFLAKSEKVPTDVLFLQSTFELTPVEVLFSRRASWPCLKLKTFGFSENACAPNDAAL